MFFALLSAVVFVSTHEEGPSYRHLSVIFAEAGEARSLGELSPDLLRDIESKSLGARADTYADEQDGKRLSHAWNELSNLGTGLKAGALLYLLWKKKEPEPNACRFCLQALKRNKWLRRILVGGFGLWLGFDIKSAYGAATESEEDFRLDWYRQWEEQARVAEEMGFSSFQREADLAADLVEMQTRQLREQLQKELPSHINFLWIPAEFQLSQLGSGFVKYTYFLFYQEDSEKILIVRMKFDRDAGLGSWTLDHARELDWEALNKGFVVSPSSVESKFAGQLDFRNFWRID